MKFALLYFECTAEVHCTAMGRSASAVRKLVAATVHRYHWRASLLMLVLTGHSFVICGQPSQCREEKWEIVYVFPSLRSANQEGRDRHAIHVKAGAGNIGFQNVLLWQVPWPDLTSQAGFASLSFHHRRNGAGV
ncbi:hypothetical protein EJD96_04365 [Herbaspirillum seropedicae]|uniref:hypothetical protein n=1 Tax=Herbaspirillum seropedicae TaxID=964 RepID=UPI00111E6340|nr:hypothetical protein [Herbaspirillum seropedicae]QDD63436.1 hypothetical protein EJD96_04365 [Herbaspirillum seropedicae]